MVNSKDSITTERICNRMCAVCLRKLLGIFQPPPAGPKAVAGQAHAAQEMGCLGRGRPIGIEPKDLTVLAADTIVQGLPQYVRLVAGVVGRVHGVGLLFVTDHLIETAFQRDQ